MAVRHLSSGHSRCMAARHVAPHLQTFAVELQIDSERLQMTLKLAKECGRLGLALAIGWLGVSTPASVAGQSATPPTEQEAGLVEGQKIESYEQVVPFFEVQYYYLLEDENGMTVVGEVKNIGDVPRMAPYIIFQSVDENQYEFGEKIFSNSNFIGDVVVPPGESVPFWGHRSQTEPKLSDLGSFIMFPASNSPHEEVVNAFVTVEGIPEEGTLEDAADKEVRIKNDTDVPLNAAISIAYFAPDGTALGICGDAATPLPPGKSLPLPSGYVVGMCGDVTNVIDELGRELGIKGDADITYRVMTLLED